MKVFFKLLACLASLTTLFPNPAVSCSPIKPRPLEQIFSESKAIFRGVVVRAEIIPVPGQLNAKEPTLIFPIKVWWHVQEIYKGDHLDGKFGLTMTPFCGGVPILLGAQYIFVVDDPKNASLEGFDAKGSFGVLNEDGTILPISDYETLLSMEAKYRKLRDRK